MTIEIDQSGKLEQLDTPTAVAYANHQSGAVWIRASTKRQIVSILRKGLNRRADLWPTVFSCVIFSLVSDLAPDTVIQIDEEYSGKNKLIAGKLEALLIDRFGERWQGSIRFVRIGKHSNAHRLAWQVHRARNKQRVKVLTEEDILPLIA